MKLHVIGVQKMTFKNGREDSGDYEVLYTSPIGAFDNEKLTVSGIGHKVPTDKSGRPETFKCAALLVQQFEKIGLPAWVEVELTGVLDQFNKVRPYVASVKPCVAVQPVPKAA